MSIQEVVITTGRLVWVWPPHTMKREHCLEFLHISKNELSAIVHSIFHTGKSNDAALGGHEM